MQTLNGRIFKLMLPACVHLLIFLSQGVFAAPVQSQSVQVEIDLGRVVHQMAGGIGASWHAMSREFEIDPAQMHGWKDTLNSRGSAWGGNPPIGWKESWERICRYASWLGMNWIRVEFSQRMYEPKRNQFDFDNEEMQALYRILDFCQENNVDVFLTQMWAFVDWNAFDGVHPLQSAPKSTRDFAEGLATVVEHLVKKRKYTCIRWLCISNEPNLSIGWWLGPDKKPMTIMGALRAVRKALDRRGIAVPLSAPDWNHLGKGPQNVFDLSEDIPLGAFDAHNYGGPQPKNMALLAEWVARARKRKIPFFLSEMGDMRLGWKYSHPGPKSYAAALSNAETIITGINLGVDAFNRWSFTNRGDLDGQWQLVHTWDMQNKRYVKDVQPVGIPYYAYGLLTRFCAKHSQVLQTRVENGPDVTAAALRSPAGNLTLYVLNKNDEQKQLVVTFKPVKQSRFFYRYQVSESRISNSDFKLDPQKQFKPDQSDSTFADALPPLRITAYSTFKLHHSDPGIMADVAPFNTPK